MLFGDGRANEPLVSDDAGAVLVVAVVGGSRGSRAGIVGARVDRRCGAVRLVRRVALARGGGSGVPGRLACRGASASAGPAAGRRAVPWRLARRIRAVRVKIAQ